MENPRKTGSSIAFMEKNERTYYQPDKVMNGVLIILFTFFRSDALHLILNFRTFTPKIRNYGGRQGISHPRFVAGKR